MFAGEVCFIMRPVVYVGLLRVFGIRSWKPWLVSLAVELASAELTRSAWARSNDAALQAARDLASSTGSSIASLYARQGIKLSSRELDELTRRKVLLLLYLVRDPLFGRRTQPALRAVLRATSRVPLLSWLVSLPVGLLEGVQRYYTYTSGA
jgi:peroxin-16